MQIQVFKRRHAALPLAAALLASVSGPALALDGADFAAKLNATYAVFNGKIEFSNIVTDGDSITLEEAKIVSPGAPVMDVGEILFEGVEATDDGGYYAESASIPDVDYTNQDVNVTIEAMSMSGLSIPAQPSIGSLDSVLFYEGVSSGPITVKVKGKETFHIESIEGEVTRLDGDQGMEMVMLGDGIRFDLSQIEEAKARETISKLGYTTVEGKLKLDAAWTLGDGRMQLREYSFDFTDVGKIDIKLDISGYTMEFIKALQEAQAKAMENPDKQAGQNAMNVAMLGLMQQLTFNSASIRFDDASVTKRILNVVGEQQGVSGEQMAQAVKGMVPIMLAQINVPALQQQVSAAANAFFDNPKSFTVTAAPASPVAVPMIVAAGMTSPQQVVDLLNVKVTAND